MNQCWFVYIQPNLVVFIIISYNQFNHASVVLDKKRFIISTRDEIDSLNFVMYFNLDFGILHYTWILQHLTFDLVSFDFGVCILYIMRLILHCFLFVFFFWLSFVGTKYKSNMILFYFILQNSFKLSWNLVIQNMYACCDKHFMNRSCNAHCTYTLSPLYQQWM